MKNLGFLFSIVKNGYLQKKYSVTVPSNRLFIKILILLYKEGYINGFFFDTNKNKLKIYLKYTLNKPVLDGILKISKSSSRQYKTFLDLSKMLDKGHFFIVSTNQGLYRPREIIFNEIGGEVLFLLRH